ncbi:MAG: glycosyltransferase [Proteobacteria bacterium]|nr:glycosyltransferase [Pseudomonadota bacterium]
MKVFHLNHSDVNGGAARAAFRIHHALRDSGVESIMLVNFASAGDWTVQGLSSKWQRFAAKVAPELVVPLRKMLRSQNTVIHSPAILGSHWVRKINQSDADIVHLHWVQNEMLSIADIGRIEKPIVWTLHDMWAFCGAEHYTQDFRWRDGYRRDNRPAHESGFDLNRWTWRRKQKHWQHPIHVVTPSRWLAECVRKSLLMESWPVSVVPNCLNTDLWRPLDNGLARQLLGLPPDVPLILFGAMGGGNDPRKGFDFLVQALLSLRDSGSVKGLEIVIFGQTAPREPIDLGFSIHYMGHLFDELSLRALYSAADLLMVPSRLDNLPNTGLESLACGTPLVAFDTGGLPDVVQHKVNGYLARPEDPEDLASGIVWVLENSAKESLRANSRSWAKSRYSYNIVSEMYRGIYEASS